MQSVVFTPNPSGTFAVTLAANTPQQVKLPAGGGLVLSAVNQGNGVAFIELSNSNTTVAAVPGANVPGSTPLVSGLPPEKILLRITDTYAALVCALPTTVYLTLGKLM